jgi:opine dehydrogenase
MATGDPYARYITEDVPMSLVPLSELAKIAGTPTPAMDALISLASIIHRRDYRREGRNLASLGLEGMDKKALREFVETGVCPDNSDSR